MKISSTIFSKSFYYIAPGFDFEPLMRFSHLCDTFIYTNLYLSKEEVLKSIYKNLDDSEFLEIVSIKEYDDFDETKYFELQANYLSQLQSALASLNPKERRAYENAFVPALQERQWMLEVDLVRKGIGRKIKMFYMIAEGLASYIVLSQNGKFPPAVLCTIQTEVLEVPNGLMSKIFNLTGSHPQIWIRGCESDLNYIYDFSKSNPALQNHDKLFDVIGEDFQFEWLSQGSYLNFSDLNKHTKRYCKAFITTPYFESIQNKSFESGNKNTLQKNGLEMLKINLEKDGRHLILIPSRLKDYLTEITEGVNISFWDQLFKNGDKKISLQKSIEFMQELDRKLQFDHIHFTPYGLEDEGILLASFLKSNTRATFNCYVYRPLDLLDIRY